MLKLYLAKGAYSRLAISGEVANPDQRIRTFEHLRPPRFPSP
jgi:hypothetical protein